MREAFHEQLEDLFSDLAAISREVENAVHYATNALLSGDAATAEQVISADSQIDMAAEKVENDAITMLSLQQPVAGDLRKLVAALRMVSELERMGDLSVHVAKIARLRVPEVAVPESERPILAEMGRIAKEMVGAVTRVIDTRDVEQCKELESMDDDMDRLRRQTFTEVLSGSWTHGVEPAVDIALLGRYYERIADHAVTVANRVVFIVTGEQPES
ncbi:phosphate signaling complex protein PhoU [Nocardioides sp.]|uniref:phosphate signaling complex protein PhoU n=1 Tax=Nocardioides sp. TaxID=35761 RepID=UPI0035288184